MQLLYINFPPCPRILKIVYNDKKLQQLCNHITAAGHDYFDIQTFRLRKKISKKIWNLELETEDVNREKKIKKYMAKIFKIINDFIFNLKFPRYTSTV